MKLDTHMASIKAGVRKARVAIGKVGDLLQRHVEVLDGSLDVGPARVNIRPKQSKCPTCGGER